MSRVYRLAILQSHPIQYFSPLFRRLAQESDIDLTVYYCSRQGLDGYRDPGFGRQVQWDIPLLEGYRARFLPNWKQSARVQGAASLINPAIIGELRRGGYDALWVHGHNYVTYLLGIAAARILGIRVLMRGETHLLLRRGPAKRALRGVVMRSFYRRFCSAFLAIGTRNQEFYRHHGVPRDRIFLVPYTVDNDFFSQAAAVAGREVRATRRRLGLPPDRPMILFASKLIRRKRPLDLLQAYERLQSEPSNPILVFVGSGNEEAALHKYALEHRIAGVYFLGFRNQTELPSIYAAADLFVLPSEDEPWGLIINEVMCAGLPVVASSEIGAVADLVREGYNGLLFEAGNVGQLTDCLVRLTADQKLCQEMGARSCEMIAGWNIEQAIVGVREALSQTVRDNRGTSRRATGTHKPWHSDTRVE